MSSGKRLPQRERYPTSAAPPAPPALDDRLAASALGCPVGKCRHGRLVHDGDGNDEPFACCAEGCPCGAPAGYAVQGWADPGWFALERGLDQDAAMARAAEESGRRCDVRVVDPDGKPVARWLMGDRTIA